MRILTCCKTLMLTALLGIVSPSLLAKAAPSDAKVTDGVLSYTSGPHKGQEVALFGVNYSVPFAYSYRALKKRGIDHKSAIDMDVAHIARLGLDAYRVHIWDRQISDHQGNLLDNEHLALFDYLLAKLAQKGIRVIITPLAWWGSGYPEPDPDEPGFSSLYSKGQMNQDKNAIAAQHNYLKQFFSHVNPYTQLSYAQDPNILAIELFNEPRHEDGLKDNENYIEGLIKAVHAAGVTKPLFYNISEQGNNRDFARRLCSTSVDGITYQWYPAGLVKNSALNSNLLPTVAHYTDPFADIAGCQNKAKMIYEFDAADTAKSVMYPAMARSFKEAGFQWATQFAYDPAYIADTNSDYNTHYLNLLYTPAKAISFMIAAEVFRQMPRLQQQAVYPASNQFTVGDNQVSLDYQQDLSVLVGPQHFYYSNTTRLTPPSSKTLRKIAGVGSSSLVDYHGSGAYFLDKISEGNWRLEIYPDLLPIQDPYQSGSLKREVARLYSQQQKITVNLPQLGKNYYIKGLNEGNKLATQAQDAQVALLPGVYLLTRQNPLSASITNIDNTFLLPQLATPHLALDHSHQREINLQDKAQFSVQIGSQTPAEKVQLAIRYRGNKTFILLDMHPVGANTYQFTLPVNDTQWSKAGQLEYGFVLTQNGKTTTFPGGDAGSPAEWDFVPSVAFWQTELRPAGAPVTVFDALADRDNLVYPKGAGSSWEYVIGQQGQGLALRLSTQTLAEGKSPLVRMTLAPDNSFLTRDLKKYNAVAIKIRSLQHVEHLQFSMLNGDGLAQGVELEVSPQWQYLVIDLSAFSPVDTLLPQSYPLFMPATFAAINTPQTTNTLSNNLHELQGLQLSLLGQNYASKERQGWHGVDIAEVKLLSR